MAMLGTLLDTYPVYTYPIPILFYYVFRFRIPIDKSRYPCKEAARRGHRSQLVSALRFASSNSQARRQVQRHPEHNANRASNIETAGQSMVKPGRTSLVKT